MPTKDIKNPEIGQIDCPSCGNKAGLRINRNGSVYVFCNHTLEGGERCFFRMTYGRAASLKIIHAQTMQLNDENQQTEQEEQQGGQDGLKTQETHASGPNGHAASGNDATAKPRGSRFANALAEL